MIPLSILSDSQTHSIATLIQVSQIRLACCEKIVKKKEIKAKLNIKPLKKRKKKLQVEDLFSQSPNQDLRPPACPYCSKPMKWDNLVELYDLRNQTQDEYEKILEDVAEFAKCSVCKSLSPKDSLIFSAEKGYHHRIEPIVEKCPIF